MSFGLSLDTHMVVIMRAVSSYEYQVIDSQVSIWQVNVTLASAYSMLSFTIARQEDHERPITWLQLFVLYLVFSEIN